MAFGSLHHTLILLQNKSEVLSRSAAWNRVAQLKGRHKNKAPRFTNMGLTGMD